MTEEQKKELENQFNYYSWKKEIHQFLGDDGKKWEDMLMMHALREAFWTLGYSFKPKEEKIESHITYQSYELVEIKK